MSRRITNKKFPDFSYEDALWVKEYSIIGIDEVGRGAFAGPVGVGGVVFESKMSDEQKKYLLSLGIDDSKKLSKKKRETLCTEIKKLAKVFYIKLVDVEVVNEIGIGKAVEKGMVDVANLLSKKVKNPYLLIDAFKIPTNIPQTNIVRGDSLSLSIASASIVAKVERDKIMENLSDLYPSYGFDKHKGYGTLYHRRAILEFGLSDIHRHEFCKNWISA